MRRLLLGAALLALLAADTAAATPGTPSLSYGVRPARSAPTTMRRTTATFGWTDVTFDGPAVPAPTTCIAPT